VPAVLDWPGPVVTTSIKPDVLHATLDARAARGTVIILDPLGVSGLPSARWTPLVGCRTFAGAQATANAIAAASDPADSPRGANPDYRYWISLAEKLLAPILYAAANAGASMTKVVSLVDRRDERDEIAGILADLGNPQAADAWLASLDRLDKAADSVWSTCEDLLRVYADARVTLFTSGHDLDLGAFLDGPNTLYLYAPPAEQRRLRPLFETILAQLLAHAQARAARMPRGLLDPRLLLALDEAGNVAAIADLPELATTARGQGIQLLTVWHDLSQLEARYGQRAATVVNNHRAKLQLGGIADPHTLETTSRLLGERAVWELARTRQVHGRATATEATGYRPLLSVDELRRLPRLTAVLVYGSLRPARLKLRPWFAWVERRRRACQARRLLTPVPVGQVVGIEQPAPASPPPSPSPGGSQTSAGLRVAELPPAPEPAISRNGHAAAGRGGARRGA
jgi:type IV secretion system protein VirD4